MDRAVVIVELDTAQLEHLAIRAAELKDGYVEHACNMALAIPGVRLGDMTYAQILRAIVDEEPHYAEWMELGRNTGYKKRSP